MLLDLNAAKILEHDYRDMKYSLYFTTVIDFQPKENGYLSLKFAKCELYTE